MNHRRRTFAALLVLMSGIKAADAQPPQAPAGYGAAAPAPYGAPVGAPVGAPMGMPGAGAWSGGYGGPTAQEALYNHYTQGGPGMPGAQGMNGGDPTGPARMPPDPFGPQRFNMPMPERNADFAGGNQRNIHTRPDEKSLGIRLDTSYDFFREVEVGFYGSEHQNVESAAISMLPIQTPCWVVGARLGAAYNGNNGMDNDIGGATTDLFFGTRVGHAYLKVGYFCDWTSEFRKQGVAGSALAKFGPIGNLTFDGAFAFGSGNDRMTTQNEILLFRRVEIAEMDGQVRVGKYLSTWFQTGLSYQWANFTHAEDEFSGGLFANWFVGRVTVSAEATGGTGGLRGFLVLGFNWGGGCNIDTHPIDPIFDNPIDTVSWVTRATRRDITMKLRETDTGVGPPQIVPVVFP